jgi:hypothetical protein
MSGFKDTPMTITAKGLWVLERSKEIDPAAHADEMPITMIPQEIRDRRIKAFRQAMEEAAAIFSPMSAQ